MGFFLIIIQFDSFEMLGDCGSPYSNSFYINIYLIKNDN